MKEIKSQAILSVSVRLSLLITALVTGVIFASITLFQVALAAPPVGGNPISITDPITITATSQDAIRALGAADLDNDAHPDLIFGQNEQLKIKSNTGLSITQWGPTVILGDAAQDIRDVHAVDLDRDGALDLVSASASQLLLWQNPSAPFGDSWVTHTLSTLAISLTTVSAADLDHNGTPDLVSAGEDGVLRLWSNPLTGTQAFSTIWSLTTTIATPEDQIHQVLVADLDRDGLLDLVQASSAGGSGVVRLWQNPGDPFNTAWTVSNALNFDAAVLSISVADLDNDGAPDILAGLANGDVIARRNPILTSAQNFNTSWSTSYPLGDLNPPIVGLAISDYDHDGQPDVAASAAGDPSELTVWRNSGQPFSAAWSELSVGSPTAPTQALVAADFDQDGDDDFVTASGELQFWTNALIRSSVQFQTSGVSSAVADPLTGAGLHAMDVHDMDRDGRPDIVVATLSGTLTILHNDGSPFSSDWPSATIGSSFGFFSVAVGDLDGDGWPDIATSTTLTHTGSVSTGLVHIWHNDGTPFVGEWISQTAGTFPRQVMDLALGDVAREGHLQIIAATGITSTYVAQNNHDVPVSDDNALWLLRPPAGGPFASAWLSSSVCTTTYSANSVALGDLDNDGWTDVVFGTDHAPLGTTQWPITSGFYDGPAYQVRACRNLGDPYSPAGWQVHDVGRDEAAVSRISSHHSYWGAHVWSIALGDLDNDGYLDVVSGGGAEGDYQVLVYANDGTPFSGDIWEPTAVGYGSRLEPGSSCISVIGVYPQDCPWLSTSITAVGVGDLNGDGWQDLLSGFGGNLITVPLWINTGIPFGELVTDTHWVRYNLNILPSIPVYGVQAADLDNDGRLDVAAVTVSPGPGPVRVWRNLGGIVQHSFQTDYDLDTIDNGATESRLSIAIKHNGRSYDHDLELDSLKIHLNSEWSSVDMINARANALFQSLRIYRDANADDVWQPSDSPVITVTNFAFVDGYQTFTFPAGDPLSTITPGETATYFFVLEMLPTASESDYHYFQVNYTPHAVLYDVLLVRDQDTQATVSVEEGAWTYTPWMNAVPAPTSSITATASPDIIQSGGGASTISATLTTIYGYPAVSGTVVTFTTSLGSFPASPYTRTTTNDTATAVLTSGSARGTATVTATAAPSAIGNVTVDIVGSLAHLRINDSLGKNGDAVDTHSMSADETWTVYAAAYDVDWSFINNPSNVTWGGTGVVSGRLTPPSASATTTFAPTLAGTGSITVTDGPHSDSSGTITVTPGQLAYITIRNAPGGGGAPLGIYSMTTDDSLTLYAAGYDADNNYISDIVSNWISHSGNLDFNPSGPSSSVVFAPTTAGSGVIRASDGSGHADDTGTITVSLGALSSIIIRDAAGGGGAAVSNYSMTTDDSLTLHAAGYDADSNYISDLPVTWAATGDLDALTGGVSTSVTFEPSTANTSGTITADDGLITGATGLITVGPGALHSFSLTAPSPQAAGLPFPVTVTAYDAENNPKTDYAGVVTFASSDTQAVLPSDDGTGWSGGARDFELEFRSVGVYTYTVQHGAVVKVSTDITVVPGLLSRFDLTAPSPQQAGVPFSVTLTAYDAFDNLKTNYTGIVSFTSSDLQAVLPTDDEENWVNGVKDFLLEFRTTGVQTYTVQDDAVSQHSTGITVNPGPLARFDLTAPSPQRTTIPFSVTVTAYDAFDNIKTGYSGVVSITSSDLQAVLPTDDGLGWVDGAKDWTLEFRSTGLQTYSVQHGLVEQTSAVMLVNPGPPDSFGVTSPTPQRAGVPFTITVTAFDEFSQPITNYVGPVNFTSSDPRAVLSTDDGAGWSDGAKDFRLEFRSIGLQTYTVQDMTVLQSSDDITVDPGPLGRFDLSAPGPQQAGVSFGVTVTAFDIVDNLKTDYVGPVSFTSSDAQAVLPVDSGGTGSFGWLNGAKDFEMELRTVGEQTYSVQHDEVVQTSDAITVTAGSLALIVIRDAADGGGNEVLTHTMSTGDSFTVYAAGYDAFGNFASDVAVTWSTTGDLDALTGGVSTSVTFEPSSADTSGTIVADDGAGHSDETGLITVNKPPAYSVFLPFVTRGQ